MEFTETTYNFNTQLYTGLSFSFRKKCTLYSEETTKGNKMFNSLESRVAVSCIVLCVSYAGAYMTTTLIANKLAEWIDETAN